MAMLCHPRQGFTARLAVNGACLFFVLLILIPCLLNLVNPARPSLRCSGTEVREPNFSHHRRPDTISMGRLLLFTFLAPALQFLLVEWIATGTEHEIEAWALHQRGYTRARLYALASRFTRLYVHYFVGFVFAVAVNEIGKTTLNYPRPHFVDTCRPKFLASACIDGWVDAYECSNAASDSPNGTVSRWRMADAHKSFPSGHAAIGMYTALFMIAYQNSGAIYRMLGASGHFVALYTAHAAWLTWGLFCGYSRIKDYRHHAADVVVGNLVGLVAAIFAVYVMRNQATHSFGDGSREGAPPSVSNGDLKRGSGGPGHLHRKLSAQQSTMTQMSDISEDGELYQV